MWLIRQELDVDIFDDCDDDGAVHAEARECAGYSLGYERYLQVLNCQYF